MVSNTYHHTKTCLDEKIEIDKKNFKIVVSLPISLRATLKGSLRSCFWAKNHFFVLCRKIVFNLKILQNGVSEWKKHLKVDLETKSEHFLTKTHEKNPMSHNVRISGTTSESDLLHNIFKKYCHKKNYGSRHNSNLRTFRL